MRKLLSVVALLAASTLTLYQPQPAEARDRVVIVVHHPHHYRHYHHRYYYHGRYDWR